MQNNCISAKTFEDTHTMYSASKPVVFMVTDTDFAIFKLLNKTFQRFQHAINTSIREGGSQFTHESVAYCIIISESRY